VEKILLIFYIHLEESIEHYLWSKESRLEFEKTIHMSSEESNHYSKKRKKTSTARYLKQLEDAKKLWIKIMDEDEELKKWYTDFIKQVVDIKKREQYVVSAYKKEVFVPKNFPNHAR